MFELFSNIVRRHFKTAIVDLYDSERVPNFALSGRNGLPLLMRITVKQLGSFLGLYCSKSFVISFTSQALDQYLLILYKRWRSAVKILRSGVFVRYCFSARHRHNLHSLRFNLMWPS